MQKICDKSLVWYNISAKNNQKAHIMVAQNKENFTTFIKTFTSLGFSTMLKRSGFYKRSGLSPVSAI